ncbi:MAG: hypothetical protein KatS3mg007_0215 [Thermoanaerobaculum sp.]|nr:MAG: hypothetical protein KatS3mg007_0215 [Thermoanaerobaculum sp.]
MRSVLTTANPAHPRRHGFAPLVFRAPASLSQETGESTSGKTYHGGVWYVVSHAATLPGKTPNHARHALEPVGREGGMVNPGAIVRCRNREWVLLPSETDDPSCLRPLAGTGDRPVHATWCSSWPSSAGAAKPSRCSPNRRCGHFPIPSHADLESCLSWLKKLTRRPKKRGPMKPQGSWGKRRANGSCPILRSRHINGPMMCEGLNEPQRHC